MVVALIVNGWLIRVETSVLGFNLGPSGEIDQHGFPVAAGPKGFVIGLGSCYSSTTNDAIDASSAITGRNQETSAGPAQHSRAEGRSNACRKLGR